MNEKTEVIRARVTPQLAAQIEELAAVSDMTVSEFVRNALRATVRRYTTRRALTAANVPPAEQERTA